MVDLNRQLDPIRAEIDSVIQGVLEATNFIQGEPVKEFEKNPERMLKITEQYMRKQDQDERQAITSAPVISKAEDLPDKDEDQMEDNGARSSDDLLQMQTSA